jgi:hypothetical protein
MPLTRALSAVLNRCVKMADIVLGADTSARHETTDAILYVNDSYRALQTFLVTRGFDYFLVETSLANLPSSRADTNEQYSLVDWPTGAVSLKRIDVYSDGEWSELDKRDWTTLRSEYRAGNSSGHRRPLVYAPKSHGTVATTVLTAGKIALAPFSGNGQYKISYLPEWTDITNTSYLYLFPDELCCQWLIWDFVAKISIRDRDKLGKHDDSVVERGRIEALIGHHVPSVVGTGSTSVQRSPSYNR